MVTSAAAAGAWSLQNKQGAASALTDCKPAVEASTHGPTCGKSSLQGSVPRPCAHRLEHAADASQDVEGLSATGCKPQGRQHINDGGTEKVDEGGHTSTADIDKGVSAQVLEAHLHAGHGHAHPAAARQGEG